MCSYNVTVNVWTSYSTHNLLFTKIVVAQVRVSSDLNCDFSESCRWHNATGLPDMLGWVHTNDIMPDSRFPIGLPDKGNDFIYTHAPPGMHQIELVSDIVSCQLGGAKLSFWYFYSGPRARLDVCTRWPPGTLDQSKYHCFDTTSSTNRAQQWTLASVELPPMSQSMEFILRATFEAPNDIVALDDIKYEAILCESTHRSGSTATGAGGEINDDENSMDRPIGSRVRQLPSLGVPLDSSHEVVDVADSESNVDLVEGGVSAPPSPFSGKAFEQIDSESRRSEGPRRHQPATEHSNCNVDCDFDSNSFCRLMSPNATTDDPNVQPWIMSKSAMWNPVTGIESDVSGKGSFASTIQDANRSQRFVLMSSEFSLIEPSTLQFSYYMAGVRGRLRVCTDYPQMNDCPFQEDGAEMSADWREWRTAMIKLRQGKNNIYFVADLLSKNYVIGLDDIRVLDKYARLPAICDQKSGSHGSDDYFL
ncbi:MAM domain protein [Aphelenchoides besseyi]|nr:MAM domain protein [Aphelenchoides besseyi]